MLPECAPERKGYRCARMGGGQTLCLVPIFLFITYCSQAALEGPVANAGDR